MKLKPTLQLAVLFFALALSSCVMVSYEYSMPKQSRVLDEFPKNYLGEYISEDDSTGTLIVTTTQFTVPEYTGIIGEDIEIKPYMSYLVVNKKGDGFWTVYLAEKKDNGSIQVYTINPAGENTIEELQAITPVEVFYDESEEVDRVHIDPTDQEFKRLISSDLLEILGVFHPVE